MLTLLAFYIRKNPRTKEKSHITLEFSDAYGRTALHYAALRNSEECLEPISDYASDKISDLIGAKDNLGRTLFHYACQSGADDILLHYCQTLDQNS